MHPVAVTLAILLVIGLVHFSYVDFRFRHRGSILWFWLAWPAPGLLLVSRAAMALCFLGALATLFIGASKLIAILLVALMLVHIVTLIIIEWREERGDWPPPPPPDLPM